MSGTDLVPVEGGDIDSELAQISEFRRNDIGAYFKHPKMQARERELLAQKHSPENQLAERANAVAESLVEGFNHRDLADSFKGLPDGAQRGVMLALANRFNVGTTRPAPAGTVKLWASKSDAGKQLVNRWGPMAAEKVGRIRARLFAAIDAMPDSDIDAFLAWLDRIPDAEASILFSRLAR